MNDFENYLRKQNSFCLTNYLSYFVDSAKLKCEEGGLEKAACGMGYVRLALVPQLCSSSPDEISPYLSPSLVHEVAPRPFFPSTLECARTVGKF